MCKITLRYRFTVEKLSPAKIIIKVNFIFRKTLLNNKYSVHSLLLNYTWLRQSQRIMFNIVFVSLALLAAGFSNFEISAFMVSFIASLGFIIDGMNPCKKQTRFLKHSGCHCVMLTYDKIILHSTKMTIETNVVREKERCKYIC